MRDRPPVAVLAIGLDAAEPTLVRRLIDAGRMPELGRLLAQGHWRTVHSPSDIGSGSVWPTFMTGEGPAQHGVYAEWAWQPASMTVRRYRGAHLVPFWNRLCRQDITVGVLDVPFAPLVGMREGFEVTEWGAHDAFEGRPGAGPGEVAAFLKGFSVHPFNATPVDPAGPGDQRALSALAGTCVRGVRLRGELTHDLVRDWRPRCVVVVFPEIHHASHYLWHTVAPEHDVYAGRLAAIRPPTPGLLEICGEVDAQIGRLVHAVGDSTVVLVFSLHGMRPANGIPAHLGPLLCAHGFARPADWATQSWRERAVSAFAAVKRHAPPGLKRLYYRSVPSGTTRRLARPTMMPAYDWTATRAFALPTDQHGWVRVNVRGREAQGCVPLDAYEATVDEVETFCRSLRDGAGRPLATRIIRGARQAGSADTGGLPDLIVHWSDAALASPLHVAGRQQPIEPVGQKFTGQHALDGFCIWRGPDVLPAGERVDATGLSGLIEAAAHRV